MKGRFRLPLERALWLIGLTCALYSGFVWQQAHATSRMAAVVSAGKTGSAGGRGGGSTAQHGIAAGTVLGQMRIRSIGLTVPVLEDDHSSSLLRGVGHIHGTALPGGLGTMGLAGHRDTFLRPLEKIKPRMEIAISRGSDSYRYVVDSTEIVKPEAVRVLDIRDTPELVLVTCYPFHYIGSAPMRFIVHAHLVSLTPDNAK